MAQISDQVIFHVELNLYQKFHTNPSSSSKDIRQNHRTMRNRSQGPTYLIKLFFILN